MLFPDRRDFWSSLAPIRLRIPCAAKFSALIFPFAADHGRQRRHHRWTPLFSLLIPQLHSVGFLRLFAAQSQRAAHPPSRSLVAAFRVCLLT